MKKKYDISVGDEKIATIEEHKVCTKGVVAYLSGVDPSEFDVIDVNGVMFVKDGASTIAWDGDSPIRSYDKDA